MEKLRGALVGFGAVAENAHAPAFLAPGSRFEIAAVAEENPARRARAGELFPAAALYPNLESLLAVEKTLDFADIATPPFCHAAQARAALERGLHALCEKPLTLDPEELAALRELSRRQSRALFTVHNWAYSPQWRRLAEEAAALGSPRRLELSVRRTRPAAGALPNDWRRDPARAGGGILVDHGWHNLYLVYRLLGGAAELRVERLEAPAPGAADEEAALRLLYPEAEARLELTWRAADRYNGVRLEAEGGSLELQDGRLLVSRAGEAPRAVEFPEKLSAGSAHPAWFAAMLEDFAAAAERPERDNAAEAAFCARVIREAYAQAPCGSAR